MKPEDRKKAEAAKRIYDDYQDIIRSEHTLRTRVDWQTKQNRYEPDDEFASKTGTGSSGTMTWNPKHHPEFERAKDGKTISRQRARPEETFHHEAKHGHHGIQGTRDESEVTITDSTGTKRTMKKEEARTVGHGFTRGGESSEHDASTVLGELPRAGY